MSLSFLITQGAKVSHFCKNHSYSVRNCIKSVSEAIVTDNKQGEIRETECFKLLPSLMYFSCGVPTFSK